MSDLPCPCGLKMIDKCDCRFPYRHHGPAVHGSKLADYLISEIALAEMMQAGEEDGLLDEERKDDMITDHDKIDLSHQTVPQDPDYPLKGQMPGRDENYPLRAQTPPSAASKTNMTVRLTRMDRRRDGEKHEALRVRTQPGISALKMVGECMQAGGTVAMKTWYDDAGDEWMEATLDWSTGEDGE